jgi:hypothetical protein
MHALTGGEESTLILYPENNPIVIIRTLQISQLQLFVCLFIYPDGTMAT